MANMYLGEPEFVAAVKRLETGKKVYDEPTYVAPVDDRRTPFKVAVLTFVCLTFGLILIVRGVTM